MRWPFKVLLALAVLIAAALLAPSGSEPDRVTLAEFQSITPGMSYTQVEEVVGFAGTELSRGELAGITTMMYSWANPSGTNMNVMFQNGKLVTKAQSGLR